MTVDEQLRTIARRAEEHQRPITVEEIVTRASGGDATHVLEPSRATNRWRHRRPWLLVAAAVIVVVAVVRLFAVDADQGSIRTVADPPTTATVQIRNGAIVFTADPGGGEALTDPLDHQTAETQPEPMDLYLTGEGESTRRILASGTVERCPTFSPDGEQLAYIEAPATDGQVSPSIVVVSLDETGAPGPAELRVPLPDVESNHLLRSLGRVPCPEWAPDGSRIAYLLPPTDETLTSHLQPGINTNHLAELHVVTLDGEDHVINASKPAYQDGRFAWSPESDAIAYPAADGAWVAPLDGGAPSLALRTDDTPVWDTGESYGMPLRTMATAVTWPSRGALAVTVLGTSLESIEYSLHLVDLATGGDRILELTSTEAQQVVAWSPDGSRLAFVLDDGTSTLAILDLATGRMVGIPTGLDDGGEFLFRPVAWSPDGERILGIAGSSDRGFALVSFSTDGTSVEVLTPWSWAFDFTSIDDVTWQPSTDAG